MSGQPPFEPPADGVPQQPPPGYEPPPLSHPPQQPPPGYEPPPGYAPPPQGTPPGYGQPPAQGYGYQPPDFPAGGSPDHAPPPKKSNTGWIIFAVIVGGLVLLIGGCTAAIGIFIAGNEEAREIFTELAIDFSDGVPASGPASCEVDGRDFADDYIVLTTITNVSGEDSHYLIDFELTGPNGEILGSDFGIMSNVAEGATATDNAISIIDGAPAPEDVTCEVIAATRVPADG